MPARSVEGIAAHSKKAKATENRNAKIEEKKQTHDHKGVII